MGQAGIAMVRAQGLAEHRDGLACVGGSRFRITRGQFRARHRHHREGFAAAAGAFRARDLQLWQWVLSKDGVRGGYRRPE